MHCGGIDFRNPVLTASGTFGYGKEFEGLMPLPALGGLVTKGISPNRASAIPRRASAKPRRECSIRSAWKMSASTVLPSTSCPSLRAAERRSGQFLRHHLRRLRRMRRAAGKLDGVDGLEMNVSCPNIKAGGIEFGRDPQCLGIWFAPAARSSPNPCGSS
jgi:dihydroorotate dehydrogenase (NAD+) catalytic subunit